MAKIKGAIVVDTERCKRLQLVCGSVSAQRNSPHQGGECERV